MNRRAFARFSTPLVSRLGAASLTLLAAAFVLVAGGCSSGSGGGTGPRGEFVVVRTVPPNNGRLFLNEPIFIDLSHDVDLSTADLNSVSFQVFDLNGNALPERPTGEFSIATASGDTSPGRRLVFMPRFPTNNALDNGGFKAGRIYLVSLVGGDRLNNAVLKDTSDRALAQPVTFQFRTADGTTLSELFSDTRPGGPRRTGFSVGPMVGDAVALSRASREPVEVRLSFDQPLNPQDINVPVNIPADPVARAGVSKGRIYLQYDEPSAPDLWIPATVDLEVNSRSGSVVVLRPIGLLPNNAEVEVIVENTVEDMSGESNASDPAFDPVFATFSTREAFPPQYDALVENFLETASTFDTGAAFLEPLADLENGRLRASFQFEGATTSLVYEPTLREVILDTNFTTITPRNTPPINVTGGVFNFAEVTIREGTTVRGTGTNPMVWLVSGDFNVNGELVVDGGTGGRVDTLNSANFPTPGGVAVCGGGNGGRGSPVATDRSLRGESGYGPGQRPGRGGEGGRLACRSGCNRGSGGGGGSLATKGDPFYPPTGNPWPQVLGEGRYGCVSATTPTDPNYLPGGAAGPLPFQDARTENNFWGSGVNVWRSIRIDGELAAPIGGAGGGGGGDQSYPQNRCTGGDPNFITDRKGGGGGAGAGVLIVKALGTIRVGRNGKISATGGNGGGGEQAGANDYGGGGGGGSGGMVILMAGNGFEIFVHGNENATPPRSTYGEGEYTFAIAADGGIGTQGRFAGTEISNKYPPGSQSVWTRYAIGGFGGLGIVQMMSPPGDDVDGTGNRLDDSIEFVYLDAQGTRRTVSPARKKQLLAWRGWPDENGVRTDDDGNVIDIGSMEGDIRPAPILLPSPFGPLSRARSRWIDLGAAVREPVVGTPDRPRAVQVAMGEDPPAPDFGDPDLGFPGTTTAGTTAGYATYDADRQTYPVVLFNGGERLAIASVVTDATFDGQPAYELELEPSVSLGTTADRYANYRAQIYEDAASTTQITEYLILGHDENTLWLQPLEGGTFPVNGGSLRIAAKFFEVVAGTQSRESFGTVNSATGAPDTNVRIGFAFHTDPTPSSAGVRFPPDPGDFAFDLRDPALLSFLETERPQYVQWDVLFNIRFDPNTASNISGAPLSGRRTLLGLEYLVLPYRF